MWQLVGYYIFFVALCLICAVAFFVAVGWAIERLLQYRRDRRATLRWMAELSEKQDEIEIGEYLKGED